MLTYAYECERCGEFEIEQSIKDRSLESCPDCGGAVDRLVSGGSGFIMKGGASSFDSNCSDTSCTQRGAGCAGCGK